MHILLLKQISDPSKARFLYYIPNRDIIIIPLWDTSVKEVFLDGVIPIIRIKELRKRRGISQIKLAMDLNMGQNTISRYENEVREADYETLIKFADYFNVSIDYLLGRTDDPTIHK